MEQTASLLRMARITKHFDGVPVLRGVELKVAPGEIIGLVGENGAGKSTLMNILFGMPVITSTGGFQGVIEFNGKARDIRSPYEAMLLGIGMVHQEFMLIPGLALYENIKLNRENTRPTLLSKCLGKAGRKLEILDIDAMRKGARSALGQVGMTIDETLPIAGIPVGHRQFVEIAREIDKANTRLLVFDEPTAVLAETEADLMLRVIRTLAARGVGVIFISHRLDEVLAVCGRIVVLRDGEVVATLRPQETTASKVAALMVGREIGRRVAIWGLPEDHGAGFPAPGPKLQVEQTGSACQTQPQQPVGVSAPHALKVTDLSAEMPGERVSGCSFTVRRGEILGVAGLAGQGKLGIPNGIMGMYPARGRVELWNGKLLRLGDTAGALRAGLAFLSEDRRGTGLLLDESIELNICSAAMSARQRFLSFPMFGPLAIRNGSAIRAQADRYIAELDIRCRSPREAIRRLSGGNQQKVCLARVMTLEPRVLFVSEPTRGIDVGAKERVLERLVQYNRDSQAAIVMISSELQELRKICRRILVVYGGRIAAELSPDSSDAAFGLALAGKPEN
jgi:simple sugar transport system ATP-binding protein